MSELHTIAQEQLDQLESLGELRMITNELCRRLEAVERRLDALTPEGEGVLVGSVQGLPWVVTVTDGIDAGTIWTDEGGDA